MHEHTSTRACWRRHPPHLISAVACLAILAARLFAIAYPPAGFYYNIDERELVYSALDRLFGLPSLCLAWPTATVQIGPPAAVSRGRAAEAWRAEDTAQRFPRCSTEMMASLSTREAPASAEFW